MKASSAQTSKVLNYQHTATAVSHMISSLITNIMRNVTTVVAGTEVVLNGTMTRRTAGRLAERSSSARGVLAMGMMRRSAQPRMMCPLALHCLC